MTLVFSMVAKVLLRPYQTRTNTITNNFIKMNSDFKNKPSFSLSPPVNDSSAIQSIESPHKCRKTIYVFMCVYVCLCVVAGQDIAAAHLCHLGDPQITMVITLCQEVYIHTKYTNKYTSCFDKRVHQLLTECAH